MDEEEFKMLNLSYPKLREQNRNVGETSRKRQDQKLYLTLNIDSIENLCSFIDPNSPPSVPALL